MSAETRLEMWEESVKHCRAEPGTCSVPVPSRAAPRRLFLTRDSGIGGQIPRSCLPQSVSYRHLEQEEQQQQSSTKYLAIHHLLLPYTY